MVKHVAMISFGLGLFMTGLIRLPVLREPPAYCRFTLDAAEMAREAKVLDEQIQARNYFVAIQHGILEMVADGKMSLMAACDQLYRTAEAAYPKFIRYLGVGKGKDLKEKMAWNVMEFFHLEADDNSCMNEVVDRLEKEFSSPAFRSWHRQAWEQQ